MSTRADNPLPWTPIPADMVEAMASVQPGEMFTYAGQHYTRPLPEEPVDQPWKPRAKPAADAPAADATIRARYARRQRRCLKCGNDFDSEWNGRRLCHRCTVVNAANQGLDDAVLSGVRVQ